MQPPVAGSELTASWTPPVAEEIVHAPECVLAHWMIRVPLGAPPTALPPVISAASAVPVPPEI